MPSFPYNYSRFSRPVLDLLFLMICMPSLIPQILFLFTISTLFLYCWIPNLLTGQASSTDRKCFAFYPFTFPSAAKKTMSQWFIHAKKSVSCSDRYHLRGCPILTWILLLWTKILYRFQILVAWCPLFSYPDWPVSFSLILSFKPFFLPAWNPDLDPVLFGYSGEPYF